MIISRYFAICIINSWSQHLWICTLVFFLKWTVDDAHTLLLPLPFLRVGSRHEICQNFYTTRFSGQKFYTLKAWLFPLTLQQQKCIRISNLGPFLLNLNLICNIFTHLQNYYTKFSYFHANYAGVSVVFWGNLQRWQKFYLTAGRDGRAILILTFFRNHYFAYSQVLPLGSLVSKLFLFLLCDLSFPCGYFFSASMGISMGKWPKQIK